MMGSMAGIARCTPLSGVKQPSARLAARSLRPSTLVFAAAATSSPPVQANDQWFASALEACTNTSGRPEIEALQSSVASMLSTAAFPTTRVEEYRYTDLKPLVMAKLVTPTGASSPIDINAFPLEDADSSRIVLVDGVYNAELSNTSALAAAGAVVGPSSRAVAGLSSLGDAAQASLVNLGQQSRLGGVFASLNSACVSDVMVLYVPAGVHLQAPVHVLALSSSAAAPSEMAASYGRMLVVAEENAQVEVVEEFSALTADGKYFTNMVSEMVVAEGATVMHRVVQNQADTAVHLQSTFVRQAAKSTYELTDVGIGATIGRHDVKIVQDGPDTVTRMYTFNLAGKKQLLDTHTKLSLDHPGGSSDQLHKCIVSDATGRGVFDGNVKVNRLAQKTDAQQLTRNLLLVKNATVNVKPNLQIIADDVKCTHGCTVSDLEEEELFYFQSRGIDDITARSMLVYSFGQEVFMGLAYKQLRERVEKKVKSTLSQAVKQVN